MPSLKPTTSFYLTLALSTLLLLGGLYSAWRGATHNDGEPTTGAAALVPERVYRRNHYVSAILLVVISLGASAEAYKRLKSADENDRGDN